MVLFIPIIPGKLTLISDLSTLTRKTPTLTNSHKRELIIHLTLFKTKMRVGPYYSDDPALKN